MQTSLVIGDRALRAYECLGGRRGSGSRDRRSPPQAPSASAPYDPLSALGVDLALWMDESDVSTLRLTGGGASANTNSIGQINDKSSYANNAAISAGTLPTRQDASVNGKTSLLYGGTEAKFQTGANVPIGSTNTLTFVEVSKLAASPCDCLQHSSDAGGISKTQGAAHLAYYDDASALFNYQSWSPNATAGVAPANAVECNVAQITFSGGGDTFAITTNGIAQTSTNGVSTPAGRLAHVGPWVASKFWLWGGTFNGIPVGNVCEILIILRALSGPEMTALLAYLRTKWGFP